MLIRPLVAMYFLILVVSSALKRDVTITGKRTKIGAVEDALASATRYYINNWRDVDRQIGIDFLLGYIDGKDVIGTRRPIFYNHEPERSQLGNLL